MTLNACTIVSKNYLAFARVLAASFRRHCPGGRFFVLLVDRNDDHIDPTAEDFELLEIEELARDRPGGNVDDLPGFVFKYSLLEANTAIKPFLLEYLFERHDLANLVYFDPDIQIFRPLDELASLVEKYSVVLTPHLTSPIDDGAHPGELAVLQAGSYNLGFVALRHTEVSRRLLTWWRDRLYERCVVRIEDGLFVDQKWMDLVPGLFKDVYVLTHPGYNVAYWNLHDRPISIENGEAKSAGEPLYFFHFSGIDPDALEQVSKHQDRYTLGEIGGAAELYRGYRDALLEAGYREAKPWPYAFGRFSNGAPIPDAARRLYLDLGPRRRKRFGDPFDAERPRSYFEWLNQPVDPKAKEPPYLNQLLYALYQTRSDLRRIFPDPAGKDFYDFCSWVEGFGRYELELDDAYLTTLHRESRATLFTLGGLKRRLVNRAKRAYHSELGKKVRFMLKRMLGHERARELRDQIRPPAAAAPARLGSPRKRLAPPRQIERPGLNVVGYARAETGMGQATRGLVRALGTGEVPHGLHPLSLNVVARNQDGSLDDLAPADGEPFAYDVNLFVVNADQVPPVAEHLGKEVFGGRYNVGFWLWELEDFPEVWRPAFDLLHEIWAPSSFCVDAISKVSPIPVRRVPLPVVHEPPAEVDRGRFGLPDDRYVFLFTFNYLSYFERKNPLAVVRAFKKAFGAGEEALLVIKTSQSDFAPEDHQRLLQESEGAEVKVLDTYLDREEVDALMAAADAYVSLHRSEGYGLTVAEAMVLGKPVIATPYSGVSDFFDLNSGYPVRYQRIELERDVGPYRAGSHWAEPEVEHAAELMRHVYEHPEEAQEMGRKARAAIVEKLSYERVGRELEARYQEILRQVRQGQLGGRL